MPKIGMEEVRKKQVIYSTLEQIGQEGLEKLTLDKVAKRAGVSKGVVTYYFKNKEEMIYEAYKYMLESFSNNEFYEYLEDLSKKEIIESIAKFALGDFSVLEEIDGIKLNLDSDSYKYLIIQMFSKSSTSESFRSLIQDYYTAYFESMYYVIKTNEEDIEGKMKTYQLMALLDGLIIHKSIDYRNDGIGAYEIAMDFIKRLFA